MVFFTFEEATGLFPGGAVPEEPFSDEYAF